MIDLHVHSTHSDGSLTPAELVARAIEAGLTAVALTDHDTTGGLGEFLAAGAAPGSDGLTCLSGVELSAEVVDGTLHVLGYGVRPGAPELEDALRGLRGGREVRNREILARLNAMGIALEWSDVAACAAEDVVGRPHFAAALVKRGAVGSKKEAFDRLLAKGRPAYVDRFRLSERGCIEAIHAAGGVAVLAHPATLKLGRGALRVRVAELRAGGMDGIEAYYSEHSPEQTREYLRLASDFGLCVTGGSDFHGAANPDIRMGSGFGALRVPDELAALLAERIGAAAGSEVTR